MPQSGSKRKQTGNWLFSSHEPLTQQGVHDACQEDKIQEIEYAVYKFEPFVFHIQARTQRDGQALVCSTTSLGAYPVQLLAALACGLKNSGIVLGSKKTTVVCCHRILYPHFLGYSLDVQIGSAFNTRWQTASAQRGRTQQTNESCL